MVQENKSLIKQEWLSEDEYKEKPIYEDLKQNLDYIKQILGDSFDLVTREIILNNDHQEIRVGIAVMEGLSDSMFVNQAILENMTRRFSTLKEKKKKNEIVDYFHHTLLFLSNVVAEDNYGDLINHLLNGDTIIMINGVSIFYGVSSKGFKERSVEAPQVEVSVKGSKEGFTESLATNVSLLRRRMRNPNLWIKRMVIGKKTNCNIAIVYVKGLTDESLIDTIEQRLNREEIESIVDSSYLKYYLKEDQHSVFPLMFDTERPDSVIGNLYEGRFAIIVDGSPFVLVAPCTMFHFLSNVEDYYSKSFVGTAFRMIRYMALMIALFLPGLYMCIVKFNSELLPINMLYSITGQRANVPLPATVEVLLTLFAFDLLTEAGTRMPVAVGTALSFVGAIVIGQAAVEAQLISSMMLIIVAVNGIGNLTIPDYDMSLVVKFLRYIILFSCLAFGLTGLFTSFLVLLVHLISLRSFGKPYLYPLAPFNGVGLLDTLVIAPLGKLLNRKKNQKGSNHEKN